RGPEEVVDLPEQIPGVVDATDLDEGLDEPGRADVESALQTGHPVVVAVAEDRGADPQLPLDRVDGGDEARIVSAHQAREPDEQCRRIEVRLTVGDGEGPDLLAVAVGEHIVGDLLAQLPPRTGRLPVEATGDP